MSFNKNTWSKDYTGAKGIKLLGADDARRKGFSPKYARKGAFSGGARKGAAVAGKEVPRRP